MSEQSNLCPRCYCEMTTSPDGVSRCAKCDAAPVPRVSKNFTTKPWSKFAFWILLLAPATFSLISFLMGQISHDLRNAAVMVGLVGTLVVFVASIYCGCWLAFRFSDKIGVRVPIALFFIPAIAVVNLIIIVAGCGPNVDFNGMH